MAGGAAPQRVSAKATGVVGIAILCSRLLGLVREVVVASLFGASRNLDAFLTAFRAPNMLRDLFAEGALSTAFVTTFSKKIQTEGDQSAWGLANKIATLTTVFMSIVVLIGVAIAPILVSHPCARFRCGEGGAHGGASAHDVSVHPARLARRAGDGNAEREACLRHAGDGIELLQYRQHPRRRVAWMVDGPGVRNARADRPRARHIDRRISAAGGADSLALQGRLSSSVPTSTGATRE